MSYALHIKVIEAKNLKAADLNGFSDPYVKLSVDKKEHKTKIIKKTLNPEWNEMFQIDGVATNSVLSLKIYDWDRLSKDELLGSVDIDLSQCGVGKLTDKWYNLQNFKGEIHVAIQILKRGVKGDLEGLSSLSSRQLTPNIKEGNSQLLVEVVKAVNLPAKDLSGTSDPYCILKIEKQEYKTNIIEKDLNPCWDSEFYFELSSNNSVLVIEMWDYDKLSKHDRMGMVSINIDTLWDEQLHDGWHLLVPSKKEKVAGQLHLRLQYTSPQNSQKSVQIAKKYQRQITEILTAHDVSIMVNLLSTYESQELARAVVHVFNSERFVSRLMAHCFSKEISKTNSENTLLRNDSPSTKISVAYLKWIDSSTGFFKNSILPLIKMVVENPNGYEVDPEKLAKGEDPKSNAQNLLSMTQKILDAILKSQQKCPYQLQEMLSSIRKLVSQKFPESELKAIGGIVFLRFICPSIFSPEGFGLLPAAPKQDARRALTLISKILINIANGGVHFGNKEQFMTQFNHFVDSNSPKISQFLDHISTLTEKDGANDGKYAEKYTEEEKVKNLAVVIKNLQANFPKLENMTLSDPKISNDPAKSAEVKIQIDELKSIFAKEYVA